MYLAWYDSNNSTLYQKFLILSSAEPKCTKLSKSKLEPVAYCMFNFSVSIPVLVIYFWINDVLVAEPLANKSP